MSGVCIEKIECHKCGGSNLQVFQQEDGSYDGYCYSQCGFIDNPYSEKPEGYKPKPVHRKSPEEVKKELLAIKECPYVELPSRKLKSSTLRHFGVKVGLSRSDGSTPELAYFPYRHKGKLQSVKAKLLSPKKMWWIGSKVDVEPFGWKQALDSGSNRLMITEGEWDAMALAQVLAELEKNPEYKGKFPAVISIPDGAASAERYISNWLTEFRRNFRQIVFVPDQDDAGIAAAKAIAKLDPSIKIANIDGKDPNQMLIDGRKKALRNAVIFNAETSDTGGVVTVEDVLEDALKMPEWGLSYPWPTLTKMTYGYRRGEILGLGAGTGIGKTSWALELQSHIVNTHGLPVGVFMLEQHPGRTLKAIAGKFVGIPFHRPDAEFTQEQLREAILDLKGKVYLYKRDREITWERIEPAIRFMHSNYGVKDFFIDNMTSFTAAVKGSSEINDMLNRTMDAMAALAIELDITIFYFSHLNPPESGPPHELGGRVHERQFTGSRAMQRYSQYLCGLERNKDHALSMEERNVVTFVLLKDREFGENGQFKMYYDKNKDQMREVSESELQEILANKTYTDDEQATEYNDDDEAPWEV